MPEFDATRLEVKFAIRNTSPRNLHRLFCRIPTKVDLLYPVRKVNSIYFDTFNFDALESNREGITDRAKVRYRWYGENDSSGLGALEVKMKRNRETCKLRYPLCGVSVLEPGRTVSDSLARRIGTNLPPEGRLWLQSRPFATIKNAYFRHYFVGDQGRIRITVDRNQIAWNVLDTSGLRWGGGIGVPGVIIEIKFAPRDADYAKWIIGHLGLAPSKHSKYLASLESIALA